MPYRIGWRRCLGSGGSAVSFAASSVRFRCRDVVLRGSSGPRVSWEFPCGTSSLASSPILAMYRLLPLVIGGGSLGVGVFCRGGVIGD